jgi:hypothetical protein
MATSFETVDIDTVTEALPENVTTMAGQVWIL